MMAKVILSLSFVCAFISCTSQKVEVVQNFNAQKYAGKWYEIARFDFKFERNLNNTTAEYTLNSNGTIKVHNKGYNYVKKKWTSANGKAKLTGKANEGQLKVSFFGPFYSQYNIIALDDDHKYALVTGKDKDCLWILSRTKTIPGEVKNHYLKIADSLGYNTNELIWVEHD